jgi:hypothetical protein
MPGGLDKVILAEGCGTIARRITITVVETQHANFYIPFISTYRRDAGHSADQ